VTLGIELRIIYDPSLTMGPQIQWMVMSRIQQLDGSVINKIAAGEVIERPANVVKELLENSIDAHSTRIEIDIVEGGSELIRITDNGQGIHPDDILLTISSHATSKICSAEDLFFIQTMGFRGEALASISEVSHFRVKSRQRDALSGIELEVNCGQVKDPKPCGCPPGTTIEIRNLFASTPVRRKFLRTKATEFGHISDQFTRVALAHPRTHLILRHNNKVVYDLPPTDRLIDRLGMFFGTKLTDQLIWVESDSHDIVLSGYVAHPSVSKPNRKYQHLFLNARWFQDRAIQHALTEAYRGLLMVGRQPVAFLFADMPPSFFDVNVHPTKVEVRFVDSQQLYRQVLSTIRTKFLSMELDSDFNMGAKDSGDDSGPSKPDGPKELQVELASWASKQTQSDASSTAVSAAMTAEPLTTWSVSQVSAQASRPHAADSSFGATQSSLVSHKPEQSTLPETPELADAVYTSREMPLAAESLDVEIGDSDLDANSVAQTNPPSSEHSVATGGSTSDALVTDANSDTARPSNQASGSALASAADFAPAPPTTGAISDERAMQILDCYLVVASDDGLMVIDQHALHERIMYEYLRPRVLNGSVESQRMLIPETAELTARESTLLLDNKEVLKQLGFGVEEFGANTVLVNAYPVMIKRPNLPELMRDIAEQLEAHQKTPTRRDIIDSLLHMMSCKAAIKAGQRLKPEEIDSLLAQRHLIDDAHQCPHGRPTALMLTQHELDRQFGRLG
jgi:DNA mismatch repair protein MutL